MFLLQQEISLIFLTSDELATYEEKNALLIH